MKKIFIILVILLMPSFSWAACSWVSNVGTVASPYAPADVQACVDEAPANAVGGVVTVSIPASTPTWTTSVTATFTDVSDPAPNWTGITKIIVKGAGRDSTIITAGSANPLFLFASGAVTTIGIEFSDMEVVLYAGNSGLITITGHTQLVHVHHIDFLAEGATSGRLSSFGNPNTATFHIGGVVHDCLFTKGTGSVRTIDIYGPYADGSGNKWPGLPLFGTTFNTYGGMFIENNVFNFIGNSSDSAVDSLGAQRYVLRFNDIKGTNTGGHGYDSGIVSMHAYEAYNNYFSHTDGTGQGSTLATRGGTSLWYNNKIEDDAHLGTNYNITYYRSNYASMPGNNGYSAERRTITSVDVANNTLTSVGHGLLTGDLVYLNDNAKGSWVVSTAYVVGDVLLNDSAYYYAISAHTSTADDEPGTGVNWETYWRASYTPGYTNNLPAPLNSYATYPLCGRNGTTNNWMGCEWYVIKVDNDKFSLTSTYGGDAIDLTDVGSTVLYLYQGRCDGRFGSGDRDQNTEGERGYRCFQQPGSSGTNGTTWWPIVAWNNKKGSTDLTFNNTFKDAVFVDPDGNALDQDDHTKLCRDYFDGIVDCEGAGACVSDPYSNSICTLFWDSTNHKAKLNGDTYTPYQCPHPLADPSGLYDCDESKMGYAEGGYWTAKGGSTGAWGTGTATHKWGTGSTVTWQ